MKAELYVSRPGVAKDHAKTVELPLLFIDLDRSALTPIYLSPNPRLGLIAIYSGDL